MTNNTDEAVNPWLAVRIQPFQDGQRMEETYIEGSQTKKTENVEPRLTMSEVEEAFLTNSENEIEI